MRLLDDELDRLQDGATLPGETAFKLYDTYGFPLDLTQDALREKGRAVDIAGFDSAMAEQKAKARAAWSGSGEAADESVWFDLADKHGSTEFLGYDTETAEGEVLAIVRDGTPVETAKQGDAVQIVVNQTPFYAESGGQIGDAGTLRSEGGTVEITDTKKKNGVFVHIGTVTEGKITPGDAAELVVDHDRRTNIRANHSATHLLHEALRNHLGDHVSQRGSLNAADRLRFDFSHGKAMDTAEIAEVEREVNDFVRQNTPVTTRIMAPDDARDLGAQALFGEKYGDEVRVVSMGQADTGKGTDKTTYSIELCGGTHVRQTGDIGLFVLLGESASSSGVRRIEALTGEAARAYLADQDRTVAEIAGRMKAPRGEVVERVQALLDERRDLQREIADLRKQVAMGGGGAGASDVQEIDGIKFLGQALTGVSAKDLRGLIDEQKAKLGSGVVLLIADTGGKAAVAAGVTADLTDRISAVDIVKAAAAVLGGKGGGGRPDMAQAGGTDPSKADEAISAAAKVLGG